MHSNCHYGNTFYYTINTLYVAEINILYRPGWDRSWLRVHDEEEDRGGVPAALGGPRVRRQRARAQGAHHLGELDTRSFTYGVAIRSISCFSVLFVVVVVVHVHVVL